MLEEKAGRPSPEMQELSQITELTESTLAVHQCLPMQQRRRPSRRREFAGGLLSEFMSEPMCTTEAWDEDSLATPRDDVDTVVTDCSKGGSISSILIGGSRLYSPGPGSLSSAGSTRRGSVSSVGSTRRADGSRAPSIVSACSRLHDASNHTSSNRSTSVRTSIDAGGSRPSRSRQPSVVEVAERRGSELTSISDVTELYQGADAYEEAVDSSGDEGEHTSYSSSVSPALPRGVVSARSPRSFRPETSTSATAVATASASAAAPVASMSGSSPRIARSRVNTLGTVDVTYMDAQNSRRDSCRPASVPSPCMGSAVASRRMSELLLDSGGSYEGPKQHSSRRCCSAAEDAIAFSPPGSPMPGSPCSSGMPGSPTSPMPGSPLRRGSSAGPRRRELSRERLQWLTQPVGGGSVPPPTGSQHMSSLHARSPLMAPASDGPPEVSSAAEAAKRSASDTARRIALAAEVHMPPRRTSRDAVGGSATATATLARTGSQGVMKAAADGGGGVAGGAAGAMPSTLASDAEAIKHRATEFAKHLAQRIEQDEILRRQSAAALRAKDMRVGGRWCR